MEKEKKFQSWCEKYRAMSLSDIKGQDFVISEIKNFFNNFSSENSSSNKKALLLYGPAGVGKTSIAHAIKNDLNFEIFELNASDFRNKEQLHIKLKPASEQKSLFNIGKVLLVDEVDGLSAMKDQGGIPELIRLIEETQFPMIITANEIWDSKFSDLRAKCKMIELKEPNYKIISLILQDIAKKENLNIDNQVIIAIAVRSKGDIRAAINDLQVISSDESQINNYIFTGERNKPIEIFDALKFIFKNMFSEDTLKIYDYVDMPIDKIFLWIEENIPYEYSGEELFNAYEALSIADLFRGRIMRQRYWRFMVYENIFLSAGISLSKNKPKTGYTHYQKPTRILKIWMNNNKNIHRKSIIEKYASITHCSRKKVSQEFSFIKGTLKNPEIQKELNLGEEEIEYLSKI